MTEKRPCISAALLLFAILVSVNTTTKAQALLPPLLPQQTAPSATPSPRQSPKQPAAKAGSPSSKWRLERNLFKDLLHDQEAIWTSPFHLHASDAVWLGPLAGGTAILIATDHATTEEGLEFSANPLHKRISSDISQMGSAYGAAGACGAFYLFGLIDNNQQAHETGLLAAEALVDSAIVGQVLKEITQRPRPATSTEPGEFFSGGNSFPSGHSLAAWSVATVVAMEYHKHRWVQILAYSLAASVSASRFTGSNHFLSDILVGSAIGFGTGRYVYRAHHDPSLDGDASGAKGRWKGKLIPRIAPQFGPATQGISAVWAF